MLAFGTNVDKLSALCSLLSALPGSNANTPRPRVARLVTVDS